MSKKYDEDKNMENILADLRDILRVSGKKPIFHLSKVQKTIFIQLCKPDIF